MDVDAALDWPKKTLISKTEQIWIKWDKMELLEPLELFVDLS